MRGMLFKPATPQQLRERGAPLRNCFGNKLIEDWAPMLDTLADAHQGRERDFLLRADIQFRIASFLEEIILHFIYEQHKDTELLRELLTVKTANLASGFLEVRESYTNYGWMLGSSFKVMKGQPFPKFMTVECSESRRQVMYLCRSGADTASLQSLCIDRGRDPVTIDRSRIEAQMDERHFWLI